MVKDWLFSTDRNNPPGSDGQHTAYSEENVQSDGGQENEMNYMLNTISKTTKPTFILEPPPSSRKRNIITAEVHRSSDENELDINSSLYFTSDKEGGDYTKIASNASGVSTSGGSKQVLLMGSFTDTPKASVNFDEMTAFISTSPKPFLLSSDCGELVSMQQKDSSSGSGPYLEGPYLENENEQLLAAINGTRKPCIVKGYIDSTAHASPPSSLLSSHTSEISSANCQGEGYVSEENALLLVASNVTAANQSSTGSQLKKGNYQANQNTTTSGIATSFDENISTSKDGEYISPTAFENIVLTEKQQNIKPDASHKSCKKSPEGSSSVDSDCIDCYDNSPVDV